MTSILTLSQKCKFDENLNKENFNKNQEDINQENEILQIKNK